MGLLIAAAFTWAALATVGVCCCVVAGRGDRVAHRGLGSKDGSADCGDCLSQAA